MSASKAITHSLRFFVWSLLLTLFVACSANEDPTLNKTPGGGGNGSVPESPKPPDGPSTPDEILRYAHIPEQSFLALSTLSQAAIVMSHANNLINNKSPRRCFRTVNKVIGKNKSSFVLETVYIKSKQKCLDPRTTMIPSRFQLVVHHNSAESGKVKFHRIQFKNLDENNNLNSLRSYTYLDDVYSIEILQTLLDISIVKRDSNSFNLSVDISKEFISKKELNEKTVAVKAQGRLNYKTTAILFNDSGRYIKNLNIIANHHLNNTYKYIESETIISTENEEIALPLGNLGHPQGQLNFEHHFQYNNKSTKSYHNKISIFESGIKSLANNDFYQSNSSIFSYDLLITGEARAIKNLQADIFRAKD